MSTKEYWDKQFAQHGTIWGDTPSETAFIARKLFQQRGIRSVLIPGVGYGRNAQLFVRDGFSVCGNEYSEYAAESIKTKLPSLKLIVSDVFELGNDLGNKLGQFEAVYCFDLIHLFLERDRNRLIKILRDRVSTGGLLFVAVLSSEVEYFGVGEQLERNTFEVRPGKVMHFFEAEELRDHFPNDKVVSEGEVVDSVVHSEHGVKRYSIRNICVEKRS